MDPRLMTSVLSVVVVLLSVAHGYPHEAPLDDLTKVSALEDVKTGEKRESPDLPKSEPPSSPGAKLKVNFPSENSKQAVALKEDTEDAGDDSIRSARQSPHMSFGHGPHSGVTTVCIQVRSDPQHAEVVCGPQVEEKNQEPPAAARYAYPEYYARASPQYPARYAQQPPPPPMSAVPRPVPITVYPARRREQEVIKPVEQIVPQAPVRVVPVPVPQPTPMVLNRQYYPVMASSLYPQASQFLRLNCGVQSDGAQLFNSPLLRSSSPLLMGYYPVGEQLIGLQDPATSTLLGPSEQSIYSSPLHARMSSDQSHFAYSMAEPWSSAAYMMGESGYYPLDMQGRSVGSGVDQVYSNSLGYPSESSMDESTRSLLQEQELQQSRLRLRMLQNQLRDLHQRADADEALKGGLVSDIPQGLESSPSHDQKKEHSTKTSKRQARAKEI